MGNMSSFLLMIFDAVFAASNGPVMIPLPHNNNDYVQYLIGVPPGTEQMVFNRDQGTNSYSGTVQVGNETYYMNESQIPNPPSMSQGTGPIAPVVLQEQADGSYVAVTEPVNGASGQNPQIQSPNGVATSIASTNQEPALGSTTDKKSSTNSSSNKKSTSSSDKSKNNKKNGTASFSLLVGTLGAILIG